MTEVSSTQFSPPGAPGRLEASPRTVSNAPGADATPRGHARAADRVEVSETAVLLARLRALPEMRTDLIERVRGEIEAGTYDSPEKLDEAIDAMTEELDEGL